MRHMTHFGYIFRPKTTLEARQCDTVFAQSYTESWAVAEKPADSAT
jgi:hypothetical protein